MLEFLDEFKELGIEEGVIRDILSKYNYIDEDRLLHLCYNLLNRDAMERVRLGLLSKGDLQPLRERDE